MPIAVLIVPYRSTANPPLMPRERADGPQQRSGWDAEARRAEQRRVQSASWYPELLSGSREVAQVMSDVRHSVTV